MRWLVALALVVGLGGLAAWALRAGAPPRGQTTSAAIAALQAPADSGFARVTAPRAFQFPRDHGPHPEYKTEWWYYTGNLEAEDGERLGFQLTFFRQGLAPEIPGAPARASDWATRQAYMAHFAMTRASDDRFVSAERFSRGAAGLAGAQADPYRVWLEDWEAGADGDAVRLRAANGNNRLDVRLRPVKPVVLQGNQGLSQKSDEPGNASYYYSLTRLEADGTLTLDGQTYRVSGTAWLDREFGTSALGPDTVGWDWFALQLADNREIMFYQLRRTDGATEPQSSGSLVAAAGATIPLSRDDVKIDVLATWTSPRTGAVYPARWRFQIPAQGIDLQVTPLAPDQELDVSYAYWEGAVQVAGMAEGYGYVEMTGYAPPGRSVAPTR